MPELAALVEHSQVVIERNIVGDAIAGAQTIAAAGDARLERVTGRPKQ